MQGDKVRLAFPDEVVKAAPVGPLVKVELNDGENGGNSLPIIPRERRNQRR